jgi:hypothetical protein
VETSRGVNAIRVSDKTLLLTVTGGDAVHLSREAGPGEAKQCAVPDWDLGAEFADYKVLGHDADRAALAEPRWAQTTLCGRHWIAMADGDGVDPDDFNEPAFAPSCRRCLAIMDKLFPGPDLNERFALVVQVITDTVAEHGHAEMWHVPGDQQAALRKQVRSAVRQRTGHGIQTLVHESMVVFICKPIHQQHADEQARAAAQAMNSILAGEPATSLPTPWRLSWDTWAAG